MTNSQANWSGYKHRKMLAPNRGEENFRAMTQQFGQNLWSFSPVFSTLQNFNPRTASFGQNGSNHSQTSRPEQSFNLFFFSMSHSVHNLADIMSHSFFVRPQTLYKITCTRKKSEENLWFFFQSIWINQVKWCVSHTMTHRVPLKNVASTWNVTKT